MTNENSISRIASGVGLKRTRSTGQYAARLCAYVEDRALDAARKIQNAADSASIGLFGMESRSTRVAKHRPWPGVATSAAVSILTTGSRFSR
jgi:hypothetical protein